MTYRAGIILTSGHWSRDLPRALPPGHAVLARRRNDLRGVVECLVEGPLLPETEPGTAEIVQLVMREEHAPWKIVGWFSHAPERTWTIDGAKLSLRS